MLSVINMLEYEEWVGKRSQVFEIGVALMKKLLGLDKMSSCEKLLN